MIRTGGWFSHRPPAQPAAGSPFGVSFDEIRLFIRARRERRLYRTRRELLTDRFVVVARELGEVVADAVGIEQPQRPHLPRRRQRPVDARTARELWHYTFTRSRGGIQIGNRGVAILGSTVYFVTTDCNLVALDPLQEEIGLFIAEVILELEEEESVKVKEHVDLDVNTDFGVALDVGLHRDTITHAEIEKFVQDFNEDNLNLDENLYSFQTEDFVQ